MNKLGTILSVQKFRKVHYYTIQFKNDQNSLFEQFIERHSKTNPDKLNHVLAWIKAIGNRHGARICNFRPEKSASALPPKGFKRDPQFIPCSDDDPDIEEAQPNNLRLYCFRANNSVVFLFDGDTKHARTAQECSNVRPHFYLAQRLSDALEEAFKNQEITWNDDATDLIIPEEYHLNIT